MSKQLQHLFYETDQIWTGDLYHLKTLNSSTFFCINPLKNVHDSRCDDNVATYRNFLFEFDDCDLNIQATAIEILKEHNFNIASITYSGSKSYHLIVSLADTLTCDYKQAWEALSCEISSLTTLAPDPSCKNSSRLSRLAGAIRGDTGKAQELMWLGPYMTNETVQTLVIKYNVKSENKVKNNVNANINNNMSLDDFEYELSTKPGLKNKIMNAHLWAKSENNYPELLKLTLWIIDEIGAPEPVVLNYFSKVLSPKLKIVGYDVNKIDIAVKNAYNYKF